MKQGFGKRKYSYKFRVPTCHPIQFKEQEKLPISPYLLGILIGDGCISGNVIQVSIGEQDIEDTVKNIKEFLPKNLIIKKSHNSNCSWIIKSPINRKGLNTLTNSLKEIGLMGKKSYEKFIPKEYFLSSIEDRINLLQGLLDTDGCVYKNQVIFDTTSRELAIGVVNLIRSLGGISKFRTRSGTKRIAYRVRICLTNGLVPFKLKRKRDRFLKIKRVGKSRYIKSIEKIGLKEMQCISVSNQDGLYITNDFIVTHNTTDKNLGKGFWKKYELDSQVTRYTQWVIEKYGSCGGFIINGIQVGHRERMYKGEPAGYYQKFDRQPFSRNPQQIKFWMESEAEWAKVIEFCDETKTYPKHLGGLCGYCDFYELCMSADSESVKDTLYTTKPIEKNQEINIIDETL